MQSPVPRNPLQSHRLGTEQLGSSSADEVLANSKLNVNQQCVLAAKEGRTGSWAVWVKAQPVDGEKWLCLSTWHLLDHIKNILCSLGLPSKSKTSINWREVSGGLRRRPGGWSTCPVSRGQRSWACSAWRREDFMGHLGAACQHLQKCYQEDENRIFTEAHGGRMRHNGHKWK